LHRTLFLEGIYFDAPNHQYLTRDVNKFVELVSSLSESSKENKKRNSQNIIENSCPVPEMGVEPMTSGL
jgi:hypothetical protein